MDDALRSFDGVLAEKPTNVVALLAKVNFVQPQSLMANMSKARILYTRRNFKESLRLFQDVLRYNPNCLPDPRIGIGLCLWAMDQKAKAKAAWQRSLEVVGCIYMDYSEILNFVFRIHLNGRLNCFWVSSQSMQVKLITSPKRKRRSCFWLGRRWLNAPSTLTIGVLLQQMPSVNCFCEKAVTLGFV